VTDPKAYQIFDADALFMPVEIMVKGSEVNDAGTEVNDELPSNTAFFGQATPDTGDVEGGVVTSHAGYMGAGQGGILDDPKFANVNFMAADYMVMKIVVDLTMVEASPVAAPTTMASAAAIVSLQCLVSLGAMALVAVALF
jgi:hypothetical protein